LTGSDFDSGTGVLGSSFDDRVVYDFAANLAEASVQATQTNFVKNTDFAIDGVRKRVIFAHPDSQMAFEVYLEDRTVLIFDVAVAPESWAEVGDGVTFRVSIVPSSLATREKGTKASKDGSADVLFAAYIDPKQRSEDRHWHSFSLDLTAYGERTVTIVFETGSGPAGDSRYDWAGWGAPRLVRQRQDAHQDTQG
jgi:hypothetical protein